MWKTAKWSLAGLIVVILIALSGVVGHTIGEDSRGASTGSPAASTNGNQPDNGGYGILSEIQDVLKQDFVNPAKVDPNALQKGAIDGAIQALGDAHTVYIPPEQYQNGIDIISGSFEGIGANVDQNRTTGEIVIIAPFRGSPADKAGVLPGDVILKVDGTSTQGWTVADAVQKIRGPEGTQVTINVRHPNNTTADITITRGTIVIPTVFTRDVKDQGGNAVSDLAYIELEQFTDKTVDDLRTELTRIVQSGYKGLILDLRRNPGGGLDATVKVADMFLDGGIVLTQVDRNGNRTEYDAQAGGEATSIPVVILVSHNSASGAEVLSGALRDHGRAKLVGEQTFGKGSVNHLRELSNGGALYVTIARWLTPNGELIEGVGLAPDVPVAASDAELQSGSGPQLYAAIDLLHTELASTSPAGQ